jgi:hypothetical protein
LAGWELIRIAQLEELMRQALMTRPLREDQQEDGELVVQDYSM